MPITESNIKKNEQDTEAQLRRLHEAYQTRVEYLEYGIESWYLVAIKSQIHESKYSEQPCQHEEDDHDEIGSCGGANIRKKKFNITKAVIYS
ncbi:hypothetical protein TNIN_320621 [Trichonephila inaurata madagascariensis]|uniref:Uncharacterized protein n=1 Tax=Trichonephila inaurata madagascariensis TaxID=2747483 RepID=A0A8X6Y4U6_9ARAC|nr:hypothetical protein TNIN_320621 [Trichonephila inaurata madagascariensis]